MINWEKLQNIPDFKKQRIMICEKCEFLGEHKNCTRHECQCFVTSLVIQDYDCPENKW